MIRLEKAGRPATHEELDAFERELRAALPADYREFLLTTNSARPEANFFAVGKKERHGGLTVLFGITSDPSTDLRSRWRSHRGVLPSRFLPIGESEGGNLVCLDTSTGAVAFWDHERRREGAHAIEAVADCFSNFLNLLRHQDIELDPRDVKEAWIDPDFLAALRKSEN